MLWHRMRIIPTLVITYFYTVGLPCGIFNAGEAFLIYGNSGLQRKIDICLESHCVYIGVKFGFISHAAIKVFFLKVW